MMKQLRWLLSLVIVVGFYLLTTPTALAAETIFDQAKLYSESDLTNIQAALEAFEASSGMTAVVVTNQEATGKSATAYADDFYDQHGFGTGKDKSGILFLIDLSTRTYWLSTAGKGIKLFTDDRIDSILDRGEEAMRERDYGTATLHVLKKATAYSQDYRYDESTQQYHRVRKIVWYEALIAIVLALVASVVSYTQVAGRYNLAKSTYRYGFREHGHLQLSVKEDTLVHTATTTRYIPPITSGGGGGGGGSSTHTSSGGSTHGGGGRSF